MAMNRRENIMKQRRKQAEAATIKTTTRQDCDIDKGKDRPPIAGFDKLTGEVRAGKAELLQGLAKGNEQLLSSIAPSSLNVMQEIFTLLLVIRSIPGAKLLTIANGNNTGHVIQAHPDGSLGKNRNDEVLFRAALACGMNEGCVLAVRAFDEAHPMPIIKPYYRTEDVQRQMLYGVSLGSGKWKPLSSDALRDVFTICPCCGDRLPSNPGIDYCDIRRFADTFPE